MFSQYSWWDFTKFVLALAIPYYAYVIWTYYREDIREWISRRGQRETIPQPQTVEQETSSSIFMVSDYSEVPQSEPATSRAPVADWLPAAPVQPQANLARYTPPVQSQESDSVEVELDGPRIGEQPADVFGLRVIMQADNPAEQSVDDVIQAAGRINTDQDGVFAPVHADDVPAARIAAVLNNQHGRSAFSDFAFTR